MLMVPQGPPEQEVSRRLWVPQRASSRALSPEKRILSPTPGVSFCLEALFPVEWGLANSG